MEAANSINPPHERFVPQAEFCRLVGISVPWAQKLRQEGVLPFMGRKPVYIPLVAGSEAIKRYCENGEQEEQSRPAGR